MAITSVQWNWLHAWGNGYHTLDMNIPPDTVIAQATLHGVTGGGTQFAGIKHYSKRLPSGADRTSTSAIGRHGRRSSSTTSAR